MAEAGRRFENIYRALGEAFASAGVIAAVADYRLYPQVEYRLHRGRCASISLSGRNRREHGGDPASHLSRRSFGQRLYRRHVGLQSGFLEEAGSSAAAFAASSALPGLTFPPLYDPVLIEIFGGDRVMATQPIKYAQHRTLCCWPTAGRHQIGAGNSRRMAKRLQQAKRLTLIECKGANHLGIVLSLAHGFRHRTTRRHAAVHGEE